MLCSTTHALCSFYRHETNDFLFNFELNQVYNNIYNNSRCFAFSRMNFRKLFFDFMNGTKNKILEFTYFSSEVFNDPGVILGYQLTLSDGLLIIKPIN